MADVRETILCYNGDAGALSASGDLVVTEEGVAGERLVATEQGMVYEAGAVVAEAAEEQESEEE